MGVRGQSPRASFLKPSIPEARSHHSAAEARFLRLGRAVDSRVLMVAYTVRKGKDDAEKIRLISARRASRRERAAYGAQD